MKRLIPSAFAFAALAGCNMTPQQQDALRQTFSEGLSGMSQIQQNNIDQRQRQIQNTPPARVPPSYNCRRNTFDGSITCVEW